MAVGLACSATVLMLEQAKCFIWNVRGLNDRARRGVVRIFIAQEQPLIVCLQETKLNVICTLVANETLGADFDYVFLPSVGTAGGIPLAWHRELVCMSDVQFGSHSISAKVRRDAVAMDFFWLTVVYGPQSDSDKVHFLSELVAVRGGADDQWCLRGF